jgi:hypothetical protein
MSLEAIKEYIRSLPVEDRRELVGYIVALNRKDNGEFLRRLGEKIDDSSSERWLSLEDVERRFGEDEESK